MKGMSLIMNAQKFTQKSLEAIQSAQDLAIEYQSLQLEQEHLLCGLLNQEQGLIRELLLKDRIAIMASIGAGENGV